MSPKDLVGPFPCVVGRLMRSEGASEFCSHRTPAWLILEATSGCRLVQPPVQAGPPGAVSSMSDF